MKQPTTARKNAQFKERILKIVFGNNAVSKKISDEEIIQRIQMLAKFRERVFDAAFGVDWNSKSPHHGIFNAKPEDTDDDEMWTRWALDNIS